MEDTEIKKAIDELKESRTQLNQELQILKYNQKSAQESTQLLNNVLNEELAEIQLVGRKAVSALIVLVIATIVATILKWNIIAYIFAAAVPITGVLFSYNVSKIRNKQQSQNIILYRSLDKIVHKINKDEYEDFVTKLAPYAANEKVNNQFFVKNSNVNYELYIRMQELKKINDITTSNIKSIDDIYEQLQIVTDSIYNDLTTQVDQPEQELIV